MRRSWRDRNLVDMAVYIMCFVFGVMWLCHLYNWSVERLVFILYSIYQCISLLAVGNRYLFGPLGDIGIHRLCPRS